MKENNIISCDAKVATNYLRVTYGDKPISKLSHHQKHCLRCVLCLAQFAETGKMIEIINRREKVKLVGAIGEQMTQYITYKKTMRVMDKTLRGHAWYLYKFLQHLEKQSILSLQSLSPLDIMNYSAILLPNAAGAKHLALSIIRDFLRYMYGQGQTQRDLSLVVPKDNYQKQPRLPSTYTKKEVVSILDSIDRSTSIGKRNYAILMLAVRLGMRASDISTLTFENIHWSRNLIVFTQNKTGNTIELPLSSDVGETIIDYIKYARPTSEYKQVFLDTQYPYLSIPPTTVSRIASKTILKSGINVGDRRHGSHAMRHTMASFLLEVGTTLPVISELLGHASIHSSMCYLRIDIESLRQCALEVPEVPQSFYTQKGGSFYA
jgi:site-specific recombinase XerD